jgi:hypothetical protein
LFPTSSYHGALLILLCKLRKCNLRGREREREGIEGKRGRERGEGGREIEI